MSKIYVEIGVTVNTGNYQNVKETMGIESDDSEMSVDDLHKLVEEKLFNKLDELTDKFMEAFG